MEEGGGPAGGMTAGVPSGHLETELENVCRELDLVNAKVSELLDTQSSLQARRDRLSTEIQARKRRRKLELFLLSLAHPSLFSLVLLSVVLRS